MQSNVCVKFDSKNPNLVSVSSSDTESDAWVHLGQLLEGVGVVTQACINEGKTHHNGKTLEEYLKNYISQVCNDYKQTLYLVK